MSNGVTLFIIFASEIKLEEGCGMIARFGPLNACVSGLSFFSLILLTLTYKAPQQSELRSTAFVLHQKSTKTRIIFSSSM